MNYSENEDKIQSLSKLITRGNIIINAQENNGKLNAEFRFDMPDTLKIQFRDVLGRKQALMSFIGNEFELWMQRENRHLKQDEIPADFSLFVFDELTLCQIRRLFLGLTISSIDSTQNIMAHKNQSGMLQRVEINNQQDELSTLIIYSDYALENSVYLPSEIQIIDLDKGLELKIKLYHFSMESFNLPNM